MASTFIGCVDESGDEGFLFDAGSSEWFVLSAVITRRETDLDTVRLVDQVRAALRRPPKKLLHFRDLRHEHRLLYADAIAKADLRVMSVLLHKPSLREPERFQRRYLLYFYTTRYLIERISWYCRDHKRLRDSGDGTIELIFSNRAGMSYRELRAYVRHLRANAQALDVQIDWSAIREDQIAAYPPRRMGLQIADAVAGAFWYAVNPSQYGFTEDRYARMLKPVVYHHKGRHWGYGLRFWPREAETLRQEDRLAWTREHYSFNPRPRAGSDQQDR